MGRVRHYRRELVLCLALAIATLAAYWPVLDHGFIHFDDPRYVTENPYVQAGLTPSSVAWAFTSTHAFNWHPLTWLSHMLDVELFGGDLGWHHLTSAVLHTASAVLLFLIFRFVTAAFWQSACVAALFALHPIHVESVAWLSERKDVLSTLLWMLTVGGYFLYVKKGGKGRYALALTLFALGLLAKPMLVTLPFVLLLFDYWPLRRFTLRAKSSAAPLKNKPHQERTKKPRRKRKAPSPNARMSPSTEPKPLSRVAGALLREKVPFFALTAASIVATLYAQQSLVKPLEVLSFTSRIANALVAYVAYLGKILWPTRLAIFYPHTVLSVDGTKVAAAALLLLALTAFVLWCRRPYLVVGWLFYLGTLVPVIGLVQVGLQAMADRYTYVPLVGLAVAGVWGVSELVRKWRPLGPLAAVFGLIVLAPLVVLTRRQVEVWRDDITLFRHATEVTEDNYWAHYNLAQALMRSGDLDGALTEFQARLRLTPRHPETLRNIATILGTQGKVDLAVEYFRRAVDVAPEDRHALLDLAQALLASNRLPEAEDVLRRTAQLFPQEPQASYMLGIVLARQNRLEEATTEFSKTLALQPDHAGAHNGLGVLLLGGGDVAGAIPHFEKALAIDPQHADARANLSRARALKNGGGGSD